ncbi:MAG: hypothetical protein CBE14_002265 [Rickettsiales bacterium TMED254]|nr:MAG: hypothetical protein CBE14_002265 [Rickettsiales bacterium TMED254]
MILTRKELETLREYQELEEKLILFNNGKRYGQVVFMAGGAGSGKGFAIKNFMERDKFKVRDVDEWKKALIKLAKAKSSDSELAKLDLRNPKDVFKLHSIVKEKGIKDKTLDLILNNAKKDTLPNLLFDITMKDSSDISDVAPKLIEAGYEARNIHLVWILTDYKVAAKANKQRDRVVPEDILYMSHQKAAQNMLQRIKTMTGMGGSRQRKHVDGQIHVVLNNRNKTEFYPNTKSPVVKDFAYVTIKKSGKPYDNDRFVFKTVMRWAMENSPMSPAVQKDLRKRFDL